MSSHDAASESLGAGAEPDLDSIQRLDRNFFGVAVFITSEGIFFLTLIITYIAYRGESTSGPSPQQVLNVPVASFFTVFLLASSITMAKVTDRLNAGDAPGVRRWLLATISLGTIFVLGQGYEYVRFITDGITISRNLWSSTFFTLTGFHGLHVLVGLIAMAVLVKVVDQTPEKLRGRSGVEAISIYWHFVDAVWVVIFPVVYLWTLFS